jgi:heme exporter protein A
LAAGLSRGQSGLPQVMLELHALELERGGYRLFQPLDLRVEAGELIAIEADNGVGKTSLLRAIAGLLEPAAGQVLKGTDPKPVVVRLLAHQLAIKGLLNVLENLRFWSALDGALAPDTQIGVVLDQHGLAGFEWQLAHTLSAGQRKRVALCRLALNPGQLWLLDEPFANLDPSGCALVAAAIAAQLARGGAVLLSAHGALPLSLPARVVRLEAHG